MKKAIIYWRKVNRKKYFGLQKRIDEYSKLIQEIFNDKTIDELTSIMTGEKQESLQDFLESILSIVNQNMSSKIPKISEILEYAYGLGTRRILDRKGNTISIKKVPDKTAIKLLTEKQSEYITKLAKDLHNLALTTIAKGMDEGKSTTEIAEEIRQKAKNMTKARAMTIARTEIVNAHNQGQIQTFKELGVKKYTWITNLDKLVCPICRKLHGKTFEVGKGPLPVKDTHPNCRCAVVVG